VIRLNGNTVLVDDPPAIVAAIQAPDTKPEDRRMLAGILLVSQRRQCPPAFVDVTVDSFLAQILRSAA
jgi:hypothetical protein